MFDSPGLGYSEHKPCHDSHERKRLQESLQIPTARIPDAMNPLKPTSFLVSPLVGTKARELEPVDSNAT